MGDLFKAIAHAIREKEPIAVVTEVQGPNPGAKMLVYEESVTGSLGDEKLDSAVIENARGMIDMAQTGTRTYGPRGQGNSEEVEVFIQAYSQPPDMFVLGAVNLASAVARLGKFLGYRVTVVDARRVFANEERFPEADEVVVQWPNEFLETAPISRRTAIVILTHDPKFDIPILEFALKSPVGYLGRWGAGAPMRSARPTCGRSASPTSRWSASMPPSASTSVPGRPRRRRCRSWPRSSPSEPAAPGATCTKPPVASTPESRPNR